MFNIECKILCYTNPVKDVFNQATLLYLCHFLEEKTYGCLKIHPYLWLQILGGQKNASYGIIDLILKPESMYTSIYRMNVCTVNEIKVSHRPTWVAFNCEGWHYNKWKVLLYYSTTNFLLYSW